MELMERNFASKVPGPERGGRGTLSLFLSISKEAPGLKPFLSLRTGLSMEGQALVFDSLQPQGLSSTRLLCPWNFPVKNTGVGCCFLLQSINNIQAYFRPLLDMYLSLSHWPKQVTCLCPHVMVEAQSI